jgi:hypothetical protein
MRGQMTLPAFRELPPEVRVAQRARLVSGIGAPRRRWPRVVAVAAAAMATALAAAFLPGRLADEERVGLLEGALAVVSEGPVIHVLVENEDSRSLLVDLGSGAETIEPERHEYWHDVRRGELHARLTLGSEVLNEFHGVQDPGAPPLVLRTLTFANRYREALASGKARVFRRETLNGRRVALLRIEVKESRAPRTGHPVQPAFTEEVVVDEETHEPLRFRQLPGPNTVAGPIHWWRVLEIESIDRDDGDFAVDRPAFEWTQFAPGMTRKATTDEAATHLGRPALWPGTEVGDVPLEGLSTGVTKITWRDGRMTESPSLTFHYHSGPERPGSKDWIDIVVGTSPEETPRYGQVDGEAVPAGKVRLSFVPTRDDRSIDMWFGNVQRDGLYFNMQSPRRELIVAAARALKPLE